MIVRVGTTIHHSYFITFMEQLTTVLNQIQAKILEAACKTTGNKCAGEPWGEAAAAITQALRLLGDELVSRKYELGLHIAETAEWKPVGAAPARTVVRLRGIKSPDDLPGKLEVRGGRLVVTTTGNEAVFDIPDGTVVAFFVHSDAKKVIGMARAFCDLRDFIAKNHANHIPEFGKLTTFDV
jgi:hypothetical protein